MKTLLLIAMVFFVAACGRIETGEVGVRIDFNKTVESGEMPPGIYFNPLSSVEHYSVKEIEIPIEDMTPKAKDNLSIRDLDLSVFYRVEPSMVADLYVKYTGQSKWDREVGVWLPASNLVARVAREAVFDTIADYESLTIHTKRETISSEIRQRLQAVLDQTDKGAFQITRVVVRQMVTDPALEESIRAAVQMQKRVEAKREELNLAKAEADRLRVEAQGLADADRIRASALTPELLRLKELQVQNDFARQGTHTVLLGAPVTPLLNVK